MKSIKDHIMFILPLVAILMGIEFFIVFDRVTNSYEQRLKENYSILVVARHKIDADVFHRIDKRIANIEVIKREDIAQKIAKGIGNISGNDLIKALPYFYALHLNSYLAEDDIKDIKRKLLRFSAIKRVETFGESHNTKYNLFLFIKTIFWVFATLMGIVSIFLLIKQMEVWQMAHMERMRIMEIFGAPMMLRSGVLFKMGLIDAFFATLISSIIFYTLKNWAPESGIPLLEEKSDLLFNFSDIGVLSSVSFGIVIVAVFLVAFGTKEVRE